MYVNNGSKKVWSFYLEYLYLYFEPNKWRMLFCFWAVLAVGKHFRKKYIGELVNFWTKKKAHQELEQKTS